LTKNNKSCIFPVRDSTGTEKPSNKDKEYRMPKKLLLPLVAMFWLLFSSTAMAGIFRATSTATTDEGIVLQDSTNFEVASFRIRNNSDAAQTFDVVLEDCVTRHVRTGRCSIFGNSDDITLVTMEWGTPPITLTTTSHIGADHRVSFGANPVIPAYTSITIRVLVDTASMSDPGVSSDSRFSLDLQMPGRRSVEGPDWIFMASKPTFSLSSAIPCCVDAGFGESWRFNISADSRGDNGFESLVIAVDATDIAGTGWNTRDVWDRLRWELHDASDGSVVGCYPDFEYNEDGTVALVIFSDIFEIDAGETDSFALFVDTSEAEVGDAMIFSIPSERQADEFGYDAAWWFDDFGEYDCDGFAELPLANDYPVVIIGTDSL